MIKTYLAVSLELIWLIIDSHFHLWLMLTTLSSPVKAHTPSIHDNYESFYDEALKKKVICPKFYSCV